MALVGEVADLVRAVREFLSYVIGTPSKTLAWKRKVFTEFVEPANEQLEAIHEDYLRLFAEALRMLEKEGASSEVVDWIYERRSHLAFERRSLAGLQVPDAQFNDREWIDAAHGFVAGVHHYFGHFDTPLTDPEPSKTPRTAGRLFAGEVHE